MKALCNMGLRMRHCKADRVLYSVYYSLVHDYVYVPTVGAFYQQGYGSYRVHRANDVSQVLTVQN